MIDARTLLGPFADMSWCYASELRDLIHACGPDLWFHGHVH